jgi:hypothetical protein
VDQLFREEGTAARVAERLRAESGLSEPLQRASWNTLFQRSTRSTVTVTRSSVNPVKNF